MVSAGGERAETTRGRWFYADLGDARTRDAAIDLVTHARPACLREEVRLVDSRVPRTGAGTLRVDDPRHVIVEGEVVLKLPFGTSKTTVLDDEAFHVWLALDAIGERLPEPPGQARQPAPGPSGPRSIKPRPAEPPGSTAPAVEVRPEPPVRVPPGLVQVRDFVSEAEERELLATIDAAPWNGDFARRVQHYGWTYNYKARKVDPGAYLGPLPEWAERLAKRLFEQGHVRERLDQVIVNEYRGNQGITKHVDCLPCFRGAIVTVSLGESWEMFFWPPVGKQKLVYMLERRSAVVLSGEAREKWKHEIPKRMNEPWGQRGRRISLTFRTVNVP
jgi:alkylated DNA repair dioxygenase AlkB